MPQSSFAQTDWMKYKHALADIVCETAPISTVSSSGRNIAHISNPQKLVYLYNVGSGLFLNCGGSWGSEASLFGRGMHCYVTQNSDGTYAIHTDNNAQGVGAGLGYVYGGTALIHGIFTDRATAITNQLVSNWQITPVAGKENVYNIHIDAGGVDAYLGQCVNTTSKLRNSTVVPYYQSGDDWYFYDYKGATSATATKSTDELHNGEWIFVTHEDLATAFADATADPKVYADATYLVYDAEFNRGNVYRQNWALEGKSTGGYIPNTLYNGYNSTATDNSYDQNYGAYYCLNMKSTTTALKYLEQQVYLPKAGYYAVACYGGVTTADCAYVYIQSSTSDRKVKVLPKISSSTVSNWRVAGQGIYEDYISDKENSEKTYRVETDMVHFAAGTTITIGAYISSSSNNSTVNAYVDNFELLYYGDDANVIYLDEEATTFGDYNSTTKTGTGYLFGTDTSEGEQNFFNKEYKGTTIYLHRTFKKNSWNTFCFPMNLTNEQVKAAFGADVQVAKCMGTSETATKITFQQVAIPTETDAQKSQICINANEPYLINGSFSTVKTNDQFHDKLNLTMKAPFYSIDGISIPQTAKAGLFTNDPNALTYSEYQYADHTIQFWGSTHAVTLNGTNDGAYYAFSGNNLYYFSDEDNTDRKMKGFRCWIKDTKDKPEPWPGTSGKLQGFDVLDADEDVTGILDVYEPVPVVKNNNGIYSADGQLVRANSSSVEGLTKGLYIVNGKKYVVK